MSVGELIPAITLLPDYQALSLHLADRLEELIGEGLGAAERVHLALCGGRTPVGAYDLLATRPLPWERVALWLADERCLPPADRELNAHLIEERLRAQGAPSAQAAFHPVAVELGPEKAAQRYDALLRERLVGGPLYALLGLGEDGHVASLFPGQPTLRAHGHRALAVGGAPKPPPERVTLSLETFRGAQRILLVASGNSKAAALAGALAHPSELYPASLLPKDRLEVVADREAASYLAAEVRGGA